MSQEQRMGRDVFLALAAVGWADGKLDSEEADAIVRTALEEGLELDEIAEIEKATQAPIAMTVIDRSQMTKEDRLFVYAVAAWMTRLDGVVDAKELAALDDLGEKLKVPPPARRSADQVAQEIALLPEGDRPARFDLPGLRRIINERLEESARRRAEQGQ
jgi:uncharacterized membrane protein YebE (DUF533 family)